MSTSALAELLRHADDSTIDDVIGEIGEKNRIRVAVFRRVRGENGLSNRRVMDEQYKPAHTRLAVVALDEMRMALGFAPRYLDALYRRMGAELVGVGFNTRMNPGGYDYTSDSLGNNASRPAVARYIALTQDTGAVSASDTTLASEITTNGLARVVATYAHTSGTTSYTMSNTFTASGSFSAVQKAGLFNASSSGTMVFEGTFASAALNSGDSLAVTWTVNC